MRKLFRNIKSGIKTLLLHKLRSMLTMLGVIFGVGSVVAMLSVGEGASASALAEIDKLGVRNILVSSQQGSEADDGQRRRLVVYGITYDDAEYIRQNLPGINQVVPAKAVRKQGRLGDVTVELRLVGTTPGWADLVNRELIAGRHLVEGDMISRRNVVILTEQGARKLLAGEGTVGKQVVIGGGSYEVAGIVKSAASEGTEGGNAAAATGSASGGVPTPDENVDAYVPLPLLKERLGDVVVDSEDATGQREQVELHQIIVEAADNDAVGGVAASVRRMFETMHPKGDWAMTVPLELLRQAEATKRRFNIVLGSIAGISLLVGGIGIMNIMLASVTERTREIGIRRAIGARRSQIIQQFLIETVVLSTAGGAIGVALGITIPEIIERYAEMRTIVQPWMVGLSLGISVLTGMVFGLYPAVRAANLDPIEALRHV